jgi:large subunit ribosomal protein L35
MQMPKMKTHRGAAKRFKKTGTGKFKRNCANHRHILEKKGPKRKRRLRQGALVSPAEAGRVARMLPY